MKEDEVLEVVERNLFFLKAKIFENSKKSELQTDGKFREKCGWYKLELMKLIVEISSLNNNSIK
jgi:hypothetical protein